MTRREFRINQEVGSAHYAKLIRELRDTLRRLVTVTAIGFEARDEAEEGEAWMQANDLLARLPPEFKGE